MRLLRVGVRLVFALHAYASVCPQLLVPISYRHAGERCHVCVQRGSSTLGLVGERRVCWGTSSVRYSRFLLEKSPTPVGHLAVDRTKGSPVRCGR